MFTSRKRANITQNFFSILLLSGLLFSMALPMAAAARPIEPERPKIDVAPQVLDQIAANGSTSYWIDFSSDIDLSPAQKMDWSARGWFVYEQLSKTASASQVETRAYLIKAGVKFKPFWIKNTILVESSNLNVLNGMMRFSGIEAIRPRQEFQVYEPDRSRARSNSGINAIEPNLVHINADDAWSLGYTGAGMLVANIDTGVRYTHEALVGKYRGNQGDGNFDHNYNWLDPYGVYSFPYDSHGHGTHTMGTMVGDNGGANRIGVAPGAKWMACRGCSNSSCSDAAVLTCAEFVTAPTDLSGASPNPDLRPHAVNNSWGDCSRTYDGFFQGAVDAWQAAGIDPVFSNGNSSQCGYSSPPGLGTVGNPARYGNVSGVGSSGEQNGEYAAHSNWGPSDVPDTVNPSPGLEYLKPQVIAPGVSIRSSTSRSDYDYQDGWTGTSMSAPHVTGLVALMWQAGTCLVGDYAATETLIENTAVPIFYDDGSPDTPTNAPNYAAGWGEIDALAAVQAAAGFCGDSVLDGLVSDAMTTAPLAGARITIAAHDNPGNNRTVFSGANGQYSVSVYADSFDITAEKSGYQSETISGVSLSSGETVTTNFSLYPGHLVFSLTSLSKTMSMGAPPEDEILTISNDGKVPVDYSIQVVESGFPLGSSGGNAALWLTQNPISGTLTSGASQDITLTFDPSSLGHPGDYEAELLIEHNSPFTYENIPVTLRLQRPADWGEINGGILGMERCDLNPTALSEATVAIFAAGGAQVAATATDINGFYSWSLPAGAYDIEASADGFVSQKVSDYQLTEGGSIAVDFNLRLNAPCLVVDPASLEQTQLTDQIHQQTLKISNIGAADSSFDLFKFSFASNTSFSLARETPGERHRPEIDFLGADRSKRAPFNASPAKAMPNAPEEALISESFEGASFPPTDWTQVIKNPLDTWRRAKNMAHTGDYHAQILYSFEQDEWLLTPEMTLVDGILSVWSKGSVYWCRDTFDNCDLNLWLVVGDPGGPDDIFLANLDEDWQYSWVWAQTVVDLSSILPPHPVRIGIQYIGDDGAEAGIDDLVLEATRTQDVPWLSIAPASGTIPAGSSIDVSVTFDSTGLGPLDYHAILRVRDYPAPPIDIPLVMHVVGKSIQYFIVIFN